MERGFISRSRLRELETSIGWVSNYKPNPEVNAVVGESLAPEDENTVLTQKLKLLGEINQVRETLIKELTTI